jgi:hypothetical protein
MLAIQLDAEIRAAESRFFPNLFEGFSRVGNRS